MDNAPPTTHRISEFHKWDAEKRLVLKPPYQRKPVWSSRNKSYLIDTILHGLPVPEIYMQVKTDKEGNTIYEIVDGQQRLRTILEFIAGEWDVLEEESAEFGGKEFSGLSDGNKQDFWAYPIVVRELKTNDERDVREIYQRLNKHVVPLNPQELRHAMFTGDFIKIVEEIADYPFWADNKIVSPYDIRRMNDVEFVSEILIGIMEGVQDRTKTLDKYYSLYDTSFTEKEKWKKHFNKTLEFIDETFGELRGTHLNSKADFYSLFVAASDLLQNYVFPADCYPNIKEGVLEFRRRVNLEKDKSNDKVVTEYYSTIGFGGLADKENRSKRTQILKNVLLRYAIPKDSKRDFTEEQRLLAWDLSVDKTCAICGKKVDWNDYELDHMVPHSKGGRTDLGNSQITHKSCNASKGNN